MLLKDLWSLRRQILFVLVPLLLLPIPVLGQQAAKCAYVLILMAIFWTLEIIPIAVTAMMPIIIMPAMGILDVTTIGSLYIKDTTILIICGLIVATAIARWNLHKRISLRMLMLFGAEPKWLMMGIMLPTWFLSMWINNVATCSMMMPIVNAILNELAKIKQQMTKDDAIQLLELSNIKDESLMSSQNGQLKGGLNAPEKVGLNYDTEHALLKSGQIDVEAELMHYRTTGTYEAEIEVDSDEESSPGEPVVPTVASAYKSNGPDYVRISKGLTLCVNFSTNIGGIGTLIGNGPNVLFQAYADKLFRDYGLDCPVSFGSWMVFGFPTSCVNLLLAWFWLQIFFLRCRGGKDMSSKEKATVVSVIQKEYKKLGPMSFAEWATFGHFLAMAVLLFFRNPKFIPGWDLIFPSGYVKDAVPAVLIVSLLFVFPSSIPRILCRRRNGDIRRHKTIPLLDWRAVHNGVPWMIIWLHGGGFSLAEGAKVSGLSDWIGTELAVLSSLEPWLMNMILTIFASIVTEVTTNTAVLTIMLPILEKTALVLQLNPLYLMFSATFATSFSFMLPVATLPNAIVYSTGRVKISDMAKSGFVMKLLCLLVLNVAVNTWGDAFFGFGELPDGMRTTIINNSLPLQHLMNSTTMSL